MDKNKQLGAGTEQTASLRLSPVELRNLQLINDPAIAGYHPGGRKPFGLHLGGGDEVDLSVGVQGSGVASGLRQQPRQMAETRVWQGFRYDVHPDGSVRLLSYVGGDDAQTGECVVADKINAAREVQKREGVYVVIPQAVDGQLVSRVEQGLFAGFPDVLAIKLGEPPAGACACFSTDGQALFTADGSTLLQFMVSRSSYSIPRGCVHIGARAFDSVSSLHQVGLPEGLLSIERLAFAKSALQSVAFPLSLKIVGEKAFFSCKSLTACTFNEGLEEIDSEAFANSQLAKAHIPSSVSSFGFGVFDGTPAQKRLREAAVTIDGGNTRFSLDKEGGLYAQDVLLEYIGTGKSYSVRPGTRRVGAGACRRRNTLQEVVLPEGVREIGAEAFRGCRNLESVLLPESLAGIGARAFMDTHVSKLRLSKNIVKMGESALLVQGESPQHSSARSLSHVDLDPENPVFYVESGLLCERGAGDAGGDACLLYVGPDNIVRIPEAVNRLMPNAMSGCNGIDELYIHGHLHSICHDALTVSRSIPHLHVEFGQPVDGYTGGDFIVPSLSARYRVLTNLLTTSAHGTVFDFDYYDSWVSNATKLEEFAPAAMRRLTSPVHLSERAREVYLGIFQRKQAQISRLFAKAADMDSLMLLCRLGVLRREVVEAEIEEATRQNQTQATACLLELKRRQGWVQGGLDLSL